MKCLYFNAFKFYPATTLLFIQNNMAAKIKGNLFLKATVLQYSQNMVCHPAGRIIGISDDQIGKSDLFLINSNRTVGIRLFFLKLEILNGVVIGNILNHSSNPVKIVGNESGFHFLT